MYRPNENYTVVALKPNMTGKDFLPILIKKFRLSILDEYHLKVSEADKARLELKTDIIELDTNLYPLKLQEAFLSKSTLIPPLATLPLTHIYARFRSLCRCPGVGYDACDGSAAPYDYPPSSTFTYI